MGGQACVFYGAAQFSKDVDLALLASEENYSRLLAALGDLNARRIAVPRFDPALLARGHAVHFRCQGGEADGLWVDVMTRLRDLPEFDVLWARRATIRDRDEETFELLSVPDLVQAKKTQREKDWPIIDALVEGHYRALSTDPTPERVAFWLAESRTPERLTGLAQRFPDEARTQAGRCLPSLFRARAMRCGKPSMPRSAPSRLKTAPIGRLSRRRSRRSGARNSRGLDRPHRDPPIYESAVSPNLYDVGRMARLQGRLVEACASRRDRALQPYASSTRPYMRTSECGFASESPVARG